MGKLIMANVIDNDDLTITVEDMQRIDHVPANVKQVIEESFDGMRLNKNGLPSVLYLGPKFTKVVGAFTYGEITFLDIEGKYTSIVGEADYTAVVPYRSAPYKELIEGQEEEIKRIQEKYPDGMVVE